MLSGRTYAFSEKPGQLGSILKVNVQGRPVARYLIDQCFVAIEVGSSGYPLRLSNWAAAVTAQQLADHFTIVYQQKIVLEACPPCTTLSVTGSLQICFYFGRKQYCVSLIVYVHTVLVGGPANCPSVCHFQGFLDCDSTMRTEESLKDEMSGSTATTVLIK